MAVITAIPVEITARGDHGHVIPWLALTNLDTGNPIEMIGSAKRTVQVSGTFGSGGKAIIEGSNNGTDYSTLMDDFGNELKFNSAGISTVSVLTRYIRPRITAGSGASLNIHLLLRKETR